MRQPLIVVLAFVAACRAPSGAEPPVKAASTARAPSASASPPRAAASSPVATKARVDLTLRKPKFFLGENVLVDYCLVNTSATPITIEVGGDYRGSSRALRFKVQARDAGGELMADPDPNPVNFGGLGYSPKIAPGAKWCASLPLMRYARIDAPGTYTITATHDLGWPAGTAPAGEVHVTFARPTAVEADRVIAEMAARPADPETTAGQVAIDYADFSTLRYDVYTAPLAARATAGDLRAAGGLANIPTETATRALVTLLGSPQAKVARGAARALAMRLPDPALHAVLGKRNVFENDYGPQRRYLSQAWVPALADDVRAAARKRLASTDVDDLRDGAFMLEAVGTAADGPALVRALDAAIDRTRTAPVETDLYPPPRGACQELLRAAEILVGRKLAPAAAPKTPGEIALWLVALARTPARPAGWEAELAGAMRHPIAFVRQIALERAPAGALSGRVVPAVAADLADRDADVAVAAAQLAQREHAATLAPDVVRAMRARNGIRLNIVSSAAYDLGARFERARTLAAMLANKATFDTALRELLGVLDHRGNSTNGEPTDAERKVVAARWTKFVVAERPAIESGKPIPVSDPSVTKDLVPKGWQLDLGDGSHWP